MNIKHSSWKQNRISISLNFTRQKIIQIGARLVRTSFTLSLNWLATLSRNSWPAFQGDQLFFALLSEHKPQT